jgi:hypothetical protein
VQTQSRSTRKPLVALALTLACAAGVSLSASASAAQSVAYDPTLKTVTPAMQVLPVHVGGRVVVRDLPGPLPAGAVAFVHQWPGVYFEAAFMGREVIARFDDPANEYRLLIDDLDPLRLAQPGRVDVRIHGLVDGPHRLRLEKITESVDHSAAFEGFYIPPTERAGRVEPRARRLEFIGDSAMTGYGIRSAVRECTTEEVRLLTDTQAAYPALVSRHFGADYQINAISGRGLIRNFGGVEPDDPMTHAWGFAVRDLQAPYEDAAWQPDIVFVTLFNDFAGDLVADGRWRDLAALGADWGDAYAAFVRRIHQRAPGASIVVGWLDLSQQTDASVIELAREARRKIEAAAEQDGFSVSFADMPTGLDYERTACDYHASLRDQRRLADHVTAFIDAHPDLWTGTP